ncbi:3-phosphoshikimate 1-carboxyvinyltransferase [Candidatus Contubernalis alkaliaceticus]|uniref:3-phosphoshikimate 1-carboxyvinyltransferase n=1 Tax=Candidatus Contubernalis alkaliaceticus TaxID=338645 RepID=UPI001F4BD73B|nr:3-phosphoshikimate 1-carboxyvinyltransferase [Candidatus Contubernalis alkalaceticus]UNC92907.1 3-phosphoshikimate 1-carboxyvinyltransferase [Candidatus Contubernalis alkalaceticus]
MELKIQPKPFIRGKVKVPGDKSISHRAVIFGSLAEGTSEIEGFLQGEDCSRTITCFREMGICIDIEGEKVTIQGKGLQGLKEPGDVLDAGNSGTTARLLLGILAGNPFYSVITGDSSLRNRPMGRVVNPLEQMGARFYGRIKSGLLPLTVIGGDLNGINYQSPVASAQVKSCVLLAGLFARGVTSVIEPTLSRDHTEKMLQYFGVPINKQDLKVEIQGGYRFSGKRVKVPGDFSSAAYIITAAALLPGSDVTVLNVGVNPTRIGLLEVLADMGADIALENKRLENMEPIADIRVKGAQLKGVSIGGSLIPRLIDEIPVLTVAAVLAQGKTEIRDAAELRVKESDRIATMAHELGKMGAGVETLSDGLIINGPQKLKGASCNSHGDHRVAMALAVAGLTAKRETCIKDSQCINISFPDFEDIIKKL